MLITLKRVNDYEIAVRSGEIDRVERFDAKTCKVTFKDGTTVLIDEPFVDVIKKVNGE